MSKTPNAKINSPLNRLSRCSLADIVSRRSPQNTTLGLAAVTLACAVFVAPTSQASLMSYEGFNYSTGSGNLTGLSGGFGWQGAWQGVNNGSSSVQSGSLAAGINAPAGYDSLSSGNSALTPNNTRTGRFLDTSAGGSFGVKGYVDGNGNIGVPGKTVYNSLMQQPKGTTTYNE